MKQAGNSSKMAWTSSREWLVPILLTVVTLVVFWSATGNDFVNYDDPEYVSKSDRVQKGITLENVKWAFTTLHFSNWHPLTWLSHMLDWELFGENPKGHHFTSILFHSINGVLLLLILRRMTGFFWRSAFVAAIFAIHPLRVESVAWISERKDVLSMFFALISIWFYFIYSEKRRIALQRESRDQPVIRQKGVSPTVPYCLSLLLFALSLMSKPMLVTLPFLLLLLDFWPLARLPIASMSVKASQSNGPKSRPSDAGSMLWLVLEKLPFFIMIVASSIVTFMAQKEGGAVSNALDLKARLANTLISYCRYLYKMVWPENLSVLYPHPGNWPIGMTVAAALFLAAVSAITVWQLRRRPWLFVGWFWFIGTAIPVIGIVQVGVQSMADRYTYVPMIGVYIALTWLVCEITEKMRLPKALLTTAAAIILIASSIVTMRQIGIWKNSMTLFEHAAKVTEGNYLAYNNLGYFISEQAKGLSGQARLQKLDEAIEKYQKSVELKPNYEEALNNLGHALAEKGQHAAAIPYYRQALKIKPRLTEAHNNLGNALSEVGQVDEAIEHYNIVLDREADNVDAHNNLGVALAMKGKFDLAMKHLTKAVELNPKNVSARSNLGNAYAVQRKLDLAAEQYRAVLAANPNDARTHNNLANVLSELGQAEEATNHYREALKLEPINPEANFNLALTLIRRGKRDEALTHLKEALRLRPNYPEAQRQIDLLLGKQ